MDTRRKCLCNNPQCAKCLVVNCEDDDCSVHTKLSKKKRREMFMCEKNHEEIRKKNTG